MVGRELLRSDLYTADEAFLTRHRGRGGPDPLGGRPRARRAGSVTRTLQETYFADGAGRGGPVQGLADLCPDCIPRTRIRRRARPAWRSTTRRCATAASSRASPSPSTTSCASRRSHGEQLRTACPGGRLHRDALRDRQHVARDQLRVRAGRQVSRGSRPGQALRQDPLARPAFRGQDLLRLGGRLARGEGALDQQAAGRGGRPVVAAPSRSARCARPRRPSGPPARSSRRRRPCRRSGRRRR